MSCSLADKLRELECEEGPTVSAVVPPISGPCSRSHSSATPDNNAMASCADDDDEAGDWLRELLGKPISRDIIAERHIYDTAVDAQNSQQSNTKHFADVACQTIEETALAESNERKRERMDDPSPHRQVRQKLPIFDHPCIVLCFATSKTAGYKLQHAINVMNAKVQDKLVVMKVGVTSDPRFRFTNSGYGYAHKRCGGFERMYVVDEGPREEQCMLEAALIRYAQSSYPRGLWNDGPGGEGCFGSSPKVTMYTYFVVKWLPMRPPT